MTTLDPEQILVNEDAWQDHEFDLALDPGSVVHVCSIDDCLGCLMGESQGSRRRQEFLMRDLGTIPNLSHLNLSDLLVGHVIQFVFQIRAVTGPLVFVGRICYEGHSITFDAWEERQ